ncbi:MAG TPA: serine hydrolase domain-containing protein [Gemmatimonadaceae bacterium]|nr:serine hydrolase domain-containing protein [Gemmatimonadaceae bacterium]
MRPLRIRTRSIRRAFVAAALAACPLAAQNPASSPAAADPDVLGAERLFSAWLEAQMAYKGLPGIAVGVVSDQQLVWAKGFGYADLKAKRAMTPQTLFRMASHSKLFTATAIMQLREQGKLRLDDPVSKYLPWFRLKPAGDDDGEVTIEQLLTHASGLPREAGDHWSTNLFPTEAEVKALMADRQAAFPPATRWKYSNLAYTIAGLVVEAVSGERWADYVQRHLFSPLGMTASSVDKDAPGLTVPYGRRMPDGTRAIMPFIDARGMASATGITSNVEDMAKFVSSQFRRGPMGGAQILSTASLREMHRVRSVEETWTSGTGIGFAVSRIKDRTYVGHGGGYLGNTTNTLIQLDDKVGVIVLTNTNDSDPSGIARQLMATVGAAVAKAAAPKAQAAVAWDPSWARFAGLYRGAWGDEQVVLMNQKLVLITPNASSLEDPAQLEPLGGGRFRLMAKTWGGEIGEVVRFAEEDGKVTRIYIGDGFFTRVEQP